MTRVIDCHVHLNRYEGTKYLPLQERIKLLVHTMEADNVDDFQNCRKWFKEGLIRGMKLYCGYEHYYPYDKRYQRVYDLCVEFGMPVMIHTGDTFSSTGKLRFSHPLNIDEVAV